MTEPYGALRSVFLILAALAFCQVGSPALAPSQAQATEGLASCNLSVLPRDIQDRLREDYASWRIQQADSLSEPARKTWANKTPPACPGIAVGLFQSVKSLSYAVLLVPEAHPDAGYRFLVFNRKTGQGSYEPTVVEQSDRNGSSNCFIRKVTISEFFDAKSKKKFQVRAADAILMLDSAEREYEADIYFWSIGEFQQEPVDG